jgi:hypothetical protein
MALIPMTLELIKNLLLGIKSRGCLSRRIASLGYPDILANAEDVRRIFGSDIFERLSYRDDADEILRWHGSASTNPGKVIDAIHLFSLLGYNLEVFDVSEARGGELIHDLNSPLPTHYAGQYSLVVDAGTLEHCFNIAQAAMNVANLVELGGVIMHGNPLNMFNHGFYNLNPTWYHDFYTSNGFTVESLQLVVDPLTTPFCMDLPAYERFIGVPDSSTILAVVQKISQKPIAWPIQKKYRDNPLLGR